MTPLMLTAERIGYRYSRWRGSAVLSALDYEIRPGDRTVLLGPNGAGKSTLLALLGGILSPRSGRVAIVGPVATGTRRGIRQRVAWMPQRVVAVPGLTVEEQATYAGWLKGMAQSVARGRAAECLAMVGLAEHARKRASQLSGGQLRRLGLAEALIHRAEYLLLDEPTAGLDPAQRETFRAVLKNLPREVGVVVSTHQVDDLNEVFDRVTVLAGGGWKFQGPPAEFFALAPANESRAAEIAYTRLVGADR